MDVYFDSAIIVKLYVSEANSQEAIRLVGVCSTPYCLTRWQMLEVKNAIRLKEFRKEIMMLEMNQSIAALEQDIATRRWQRPDYITATVEAKAEELSVGHSAVLGCRTLDIIHAAAAVAIGVKEFVTFDGRQAALVVKP